MGLLSFTGHLVKKAVRYVSSPCHTSISWLSTNSYSVGDRNILLMGPPGAGKTSVGRIVAHKLGLPVIDVDDDVLEKTWNMPVAAKLSVVGGERFIEEEGQAVCNFFATGSVISLTGSNPLHSAAMQHLKQTGLVIYLDVDTEDIVQRLSKMKINRIVGQEAGVSMRKILQYRKQFYEKWLDIRVFCGTGDSLEDVSEKVMRAVKRYQNPDTEIYISTRGDTKAAANKDTYFSDVVLEGLSPDGGLYVPQNGFPEIDSREWRRLAGMSYPERALVILEKCIHPIDVPAPELSRMIFKAYGTNFASGSVAPVLRLTGNQYVQELFHGPTASFKDLALQLMPQLFAYCLPQMCNYLILVATSGDTGSAVLSGFSALSPVDRRRTGVLVFFPEGGVSEIQKLQMMGYNGDNARAVSVLSDFDFCQRSIKQMFGEPAVMGHLAVEYGTVLSTANSINWARLLPQVVYHSSAYLDLFRDSVINFGEPVDVCIPTGNFGNAMSALYAKQMGVPIRRVICASNHNHIVSDFVNTGEYDLRRRPLVPSHSPAIDILKSSNLERLIYHASGGDGRLVQDLFVRLERDGHFKVPQPLHRKIQEDVRAGWCSEGDCLATIQNVHAETGYIMDTHTAVAKTVADKLQDGACPTVICSTAHHGKFAPAVLGALQQHDISKAPMDQLRKLGALGSRPEMHRQLLESARDSGSGAHTVCQADYSVLVEEVETMIQNTFLKAT